MGTLVNSMLEIPTSSLSKVPLSLGIWTTSNTQFLETTRVHIPNGISIGSAVFAGLTVVTDRQTDRPRYSVYSNKLHLASAAMRPNKNGYDDIRPRSVPDHFGPI